MSIKKAYAPLWLTFCSMVFFASPIKADSLRVIPRKNDPKGEIIREESN